MAWVKRKLRTEVIPRVTFIYKRKTYYIGRRPPFFKELFSLLQRFVVFTFIYALIILFILFVLLAAYDVFNFITALFKLWFSVLIKKN